MPLTQGCRLDERSGASPPARSGPETGLHTGSMTQGQVSMGVVCSMHPGEHAGPAQDVLHALCGAAQRPPGSPTIYRPDPACIFDARALIQFFISNLLHSRQVIWTAKAFKQVALAHCLCFLFFLIILPPSIYTPELTTPQHCCKRWSIRIRINAIFHEEGKGKQKPHSTARNPDPCPIPEGFNCTFQTRL